MLQFSLFDSAPPPSQGALGNGLPHTSKRMARPALPRPIGIPPRIARTTPVPASSAASSQETKLAAPSPRRPPAPINVEGLRFVPGSLDGHMIARVYDQRLRDGQRSYLISTRHGDGVALSISSGNGSTARRSFHTSVAAAITAAGEAEKALRAKPEANGPSGHLRVAGAS